MQTPLNLEKEHHALLQRWSERYPERESTPETEFTWDGPSDWGQWTLQKTKILFLLKEAHSGYHPSSPQDAYLQTRFFRNIVRWKNLVQCFIKSSPEVPKFSDEEIRPGDLSDIAVVNVKKMQEGKTTSNRKEILSYAVRDKNCLMKQIDLLSPHVVFCGNTMEAYDKIYDEKYDPYKHLDPENPVGKVNCWKLNERLVIEFYHPSIRRSENEMYSLLSSLLERSEIRGRFNWIESRSAQNPELLSGGAAALDQGIGAGM